jgi:glutamate-1-semialdehyde 2,1-aminomutase
MVSAVGFGTCQLRLVTETQAIDTLLRGFDLGVNLVHTAPDYEGAENLVAKAMTRSSKRVIVASQGYDVHGNSDGPVRHFEHLFESTCRRFRTDRLDLYGIACVDDREAFRENVWGRRGMVEFLQKKKAQGRLGGIFCTTHGSPEFVAKLVRSGAFDAIMVAYNELGFHLLSYSPPPGRHFEDLPRNKAEIFPLCRELDVGVMIMKPLGGGLLCRGRAFPPRFDDDWPRPTATEILRSILANPEVTCVVPGTSSVEEADENARAGHTSPHAPTPREATLPEQIALLQTNLCSRCGLCDTQCSQNLRVSWMFRAGYVAKYPSETFETWDAVEYFRLHPKDDAVCATCSDVTCACPAGIDIPRSLTRLHAEMLELREQGLVGSAAPSAPEASNSAEFRARLVLRELPTVLAPDEQALVRIGVQNTGTRSWLVEKHRHRVKLGVMLGEEQTLMVPIRGDVHPGGRSHFVFELRASAVPGHFPLRLQLLGEHERFSTKTGPILHEGAIDVVGAGSVPEQREQSNGAHRGGLAVEWLEHNLPLEWPEGSPLYAYMRLANRGRDTWRADHSEGRRVELTVQFRLGRTHRVPLPRAVAPGEEITLGVPLTLVGGFGSCWTVRFGLVERGRGWFGPRRARPLVVRIRKAPAATGPTAEALAVARRANNWGYQPTEGVARGRDGRPYPLFIREARGCRIRDLEGNEWIDFVMGWGSALLGYAHPEVQAAVAPHLGSGAVLSLPSGLEMKLTEALLARFPSSEAVLFGKNGSDVCTAAVRVARMYTGRRTILFSGYHGWQDWYADAASPELAGPHAVRTAFRFRFNDVDNFRRRVDEHRGQIAAVILEPAAQVEGVDGPVRDADPHFLTSVATICRKHGILLVYDEIMTGFRHPGGSVQKATGVIPDLTCLGKALTSGWPLAALLGPRDILAPTMGRIYYHPTFKGEAYSFAAALAALAVFDREDVPARVRAFGQRLMAEVNDVCRELSVAGGLVGQPYRMVYRFEEPDRERCTLKRTLLKQELMKRGVLTFRGFLLPSLAHGDEELAFTVDAYRAALAVVRHADVDGSFARRLEVPLVK